MYRYYHNYNYGDDEGAIKYAQTVQDTKCEVAEYLIGHFALYSGCSHTVQSGQLDMYLHPIASFPGPLLERILRTTFEPRGIASRAGESLGTRLSASCAALPYIYLKLCYN